MTSCAKALSAVIGWVKPRCMSSAMWPCSRCNCPANSSGISIVSCIDQTLSAEADSVNLSANLVCPGPRRWNYIPKLRGNGLERRHGWANGLGNVLFLFLLLFGHEVLAFLQERIDGPFADEISPLIKLLLVLELFLELLGLFFEFLVELFLVFRFLVVSGSAFPGEVALNVHF